MSSLEVGPHRVAYRELGDGAPVVLLHSGGLGARQWRRLGDALAPSHRVVLPDLLGYGGSTRWRDGEPFELALDVAVITALVDHVIAQHGGPIALVGHSYGGLIAAHVALARPAQVRAMALCEPVTFGVLSTAERAELDGLPLDYAAPPDGTDDRWLAAFVAWWNGPGAWDALTDDVRASFRQVAWKLFCEVASLVRDTTPAAAFAQVTAPTLILRGARTPMTEQRVCEALARALPHASLQIIPGAGHMAPITHAAEVNAAILAHLAGAGA